jgi:hypothetical protein
MKIVFSGKVEMMNQTQKNKTKKAQVLGRKQWKRVDETSQDAIFGSATRSATVIKSGHLVNHFQTFFSFFCLL